MGHLGIKQEALREFLRRVGRSFPYNGLSSSAPAAGAMSSWRVTTTSSWSQRPSKASPGRNASGLS